MRTNQKLGKRIQGLRKQSSLTQEQFAEKLNISRTHIGHIEQGRKYPSMKLMEKIAKTLQIKVKDIFPY